MTGQALVVQGDALRLPLPDRSIDAVICDPPYSLSFMGRQWDSFGGPQAFQAWCQQWATEALRVLKPGGWVLAFGGTRTWHRLACGLEDAGFELRDTIAEFSPGGDAAEVSYGPLAWVYGSGFPSSKSLDVSKAIDKMAGAEREVVGHKRLSGNALVPTSEKGGTYGVGVGTAPPGDVPITAPATPEAERWQGWGTALKPSWEPVIVARKPLSGTVAQNVLTYGTGALNIDAARIEGVVQAGAGTLHTFHGGEDGYQRGTGRTYQTQGRWPPNVALVHSPGCQPTGTRKIRTKDRCSTQRSTSPRYSGRTYNAGEVGGVKEDKPIGYADADGMEEITAWTCEKDCPVALLDQQSGNRPGGHTQGDLRTTPSRYFEADKHPGYREGFNDQGGASRFFYTAKAGPNERVTIDGEGHPTVKPLTLMRWLVRLVTPPGGIVLDMFAGSGTTGEAAMLEGFRCVLIDKDPANLPSIRVRTHPYVRRTKIITNGQVGPEQGRLL